MLSVKQLTKHYSAPNQDRAIEIIQDLTFEVLPGEFVSFLGPSGCGKSTLLKLLAGLLSASSGESHLAGQLIQEPHPERGLVTQQMSLFPWMTVEENMTFPLKLKGISLKNRRLQAQPFLEVTGLTTYKSYFPYQLSGGMQQRVAIARALMADPKLLLLDEPFASLDAQNRSSMQEFLLGICRRTRMTVVLVTHDIREAIFLSDRIFVVEKQPMRIRRTFTVPLPRQRTHEIKRQSSFLELEYTIEKELRNNHFV